MGNVKIDELQKLYDDPKTDSFLQEICEYYATRCDYTEDSFQEEIEPAEIMEPVYTLFCLQKREEILDEFEYIHQKYPHLFESVSGFCNRILTNMDYRALQSECEHQLVTAVGHISSAEIYDRIETICRNEADFSKGVDQFFQWLHKK
jgi:hypothetical protein